MAGQIPADWSAETPLLLDLELDVLRSKVDAGKCYEEIFHALWKPEMLDPVSPAAGADVEMMKLLFHTIPRALLRAVLMKTVAYDFYKVDDTTWRVLSKDSDAGAYVASLYIHDRGGKFVNLEEMEELIKRMESYARANELYYEEGLDEDYIPATRVEKEARQILHQAMEVDYALKRGQEWDRETFEKPKFCSKDAANVRACVRMLERWVAAHPLDGREKYWRQSPLMVGNSGKRAGRMIHHDPIVYGVEHTPKLWGLTLSILTTMGLKTRVIAVPLIGCWVEDQVNPAETLGTVLARSMTDSYVSTSSSQGPGLVWWTRMC